MNEEKLNIAVKEAQRCILTFLSDVTNPDIVAKVNEIFDKCAVRIETDERELAAGIAYPGEIAILNKYLEHTSLSNEYEFDNLLCTIIHEYSHHFRKINSRYGGMLEEAFASIFAETCINYSKLKRQSKDEEIDLYTYSNSLDYERADSHVRTILYFAKQTGVDMSMMLEYVLGSETNFKNMCTQIFGKNFLEYYSLASKVNTNEKQVIDVENLLIELICEYIKNNDVSLKDYYSPKVNQISSNNLYFTGTPVLSKAVVKAGINSLKEDERRLFKIFEYSAGVDDERNHLIEKAKIEKVRQKLARFNLSNKTPDEVLDALIDLCSDYIQFKTSEDEELTIYIAEIQKMIPNIQEFCLLFRELRVMGKDRQILENMDLNNLTYQLLFEKMKSLMSEHEITEEDKERIGNKKVNK